MKQVKIGGEKIDIQATPYSLVVHESEFGSDLIEDTMKLSAVMVSERVNGLLAMRITYTLAKTAALIKNSNQVFPEFNAWLMGIEALDLGNADMYSEVIDEIQRKLFVAPKSSKKKSSNNQSKNDYSTGTYILVLAKKMHMRVPEELNILTLQQFYDMSDVYFGTTEEESNVREATQDDIDRYMG